MSDWEQGYRTALQDVLEEIRQHGKQSLAAWVQAKIDATTPTWSPPAIVTTHCDGAD